MPVYEYECADCGIRFERLVRRQGMSPTHACPECEQPAPKQVSAAAFSFAHKVQGGPRPQNTGVHSIDYNMDRVIGRDAEQRWKTIESRQARKRQIIRDNPGVSGWDLSRTPDGQDYRVMKPEERRAADAATSLHDKATKAIQADKASRSEKAV